MRCALCGADAGEYGHNPEPLSDWDDRVCAPYNTTFVVPTRTGVFNTPQVAVIRALFTVQRHLAAERTSRNA